jgi:hypothetical protein
MSALDDRMNDKSHRYVGNPDFHDGFVRSISQQGNRVLVAVEGATGKNYNVGFDGVSSMESLSPQGMMLFAVSGQGTDVESLRRYDFINWHVDQSEKGESKSYLRIVASGFTITEE